jgi:hypothetical protein
MPIQKRGSFIRDSVFRLTRLPPATGVTRNLTSWLEQECFNEACASSTSSYRTSVRLNDEELNWLDCRCCELRRGGWHSISRSTLIRALLKAISDAPVTLWGVSTEEELTEALRQALLKTPQSS